MQRTLTSKFVLWDKGAPEPRVESIPPRGGIFFAKTKTFQILQMCPYLFYVADVDWSIYKFLKHGVSGFDPKYVHILIKPYNVYTLYTAAYEYRLARMVTLDAWSLTPLDVFLKHLPPTV